MNRRTTSSILLVTAALTAATAATMPTAQAASRPSVSMTVVHAQITSGGRPSFRFSSANIGRATLQLQRQFGTRHVWEKVLNLTTKSGTVRAPALAMGKYEYRVIAHRGTTTVATSPTRAVYSYGNVSANRLCNSTNDMYFYDSCGSGTIQVGPRVYDYTMDDGRGNTAPNGSPGVTAQHSSCRSANLTYALSNDSANNGYNQVGATMTQTSADEQDTQTRANSVGTANFAIRSGSWDLAFWSSDGHGDSTYVYWTGTFSCYTGNGQS